MKAPGLWVRSDASRQARAVMLALLWLALTECVAGASRSGAPVEAAMAREGAGETGQAAAPAASGKPHGLSFKGLELYSWPEREVGWRYALLVGTNRLKLPEQLRVAAVSEQELRELLAGLPAAEAVTWCHRLGAAMQPALADPPAAIRDQLMPWRRRRACGS